jgi:hypothetical protein
MGDTPWTVASPRDDAGISDESLAILRSPIGPQAPRARRVEIKAIHVRTVTVAKIPAVKLPPVDDKIKHKIRAHMICVVFSGIMLWAASFVALGMLGHVMEVGSVVPNALMEFLDRIHDR